MQYGWNYDYAVTQYKQSMCFKIKFVIVGGQAYPNNGSTETLESEFIESDDAVVLYTFLESMRPIPPTANLYFKLYREPSCSAASMLSFMESMQKFSVLKIQNGTTFYVKKDSEPHL